MSKTQLKKTIAGLNEEQLRMLIIDVYEARKEAKEYLDFFVAPDIDKMMTKYKTAIDKEMGRITRGRARPRMTRVRKSLHDFASFNPGAEYTAELMVHAIERACRAGSDAWIKDVTQRSIAKHLGETLIYLDRNGIVSDFMPRIVMAIDGMKSGFFYNNSFKRLLQETLEDFSTLND